MKILSLNAGSSSIKYSLFDAAKNYRLLIKGIAERIGQQGSSISHTIENGHKEKEIPLPDHRTAMYQLHQALIDFDAINAVGHRIVHGGERLRNTTLITEEVIDLIKEAARFAPLHCQPNLIGIEVLRELYPHVPHVAVFDTAAHMTMDFKAFLYGIPIEYYEKYKIRKYGFHGINHSYVANQAAKILAKQFNELKIITCHLGNGCSINAFENGKSIDNSMGLTPLEGLVMGSRCGDLDPSVVLYLIDVLGLQISQVADLLNKKSGLLGLCGKSDMRDIIATAANGDNFAHMAIEIFIYRIQKYIGAFIAALNGVDVIVFTGGIGENSPYIRARVTANFTYMKAFIDIEKNEKDKTVFSSNDSYVLLMTIPANEEIVIAEQTSPFLKA